MKIIIDVEEIMENSNRYIFKSNGRSYIFYKNEVKSLAKAEEEKKELVEALKKQLQMIKEITCTCGAMYTSRRLIAPDCPKCNIDITALDNIDTLEQLLQKHSEE